VWGEPTFESCRSNLDTFCIKGNVTDMSRRKVRTNKARGKGNEVRERSTATLGPENEGSFYAVDEGRIFTRISGNCLKEKTDVQF